MSRRFVSEPAAPQERGLAFGRAHADAIAGNVAGYRELFAGVGGLATGEVQRLGDEALDVVEAWAPALREELAGMATGAGVPEHALGALNARTEILGRCRAAARECSTAVLLDPGRPPLAAQTWDWHEHLRPGWLVWTIEHPSGRVVHTLTEHGIVGKIGVSSAGIGLLVNILRHAGDGEGIGTPVHVIARRILDEADDVYAALQILAGTRPSASSALTLVAYEDGEATALTAEVRPGGVAHVLPSEQGVLVHTNHFLDERAAAGDLEPTLGPDSLVRYDVLRRRLAALRERSDDALLASLRCHLGGAGALCCHADPSAPLGERFATLATLSLDAAACRLVVRDGAPCEDAAETVDTSPPTREARWASSR